VYLGTELLEDQVLVYDNGKFGTSRSWVFTASPSATFMITSEPTMSPSMSKVPSSSSAPTSPEQLVLVVIRLDVYPDETSWEILDATDGAVVFSGGEYDTIESFIFVNTTVSLDLNGVYDFVVYDRGSNGFCCDGFAAVFLGTEGTESNYLAFVEGNFGSIATQRFIASQAGVIVVSPAPSSVPSLVPSLEPSSSSAPTGVQVPITVEIHTDAFPSELGWSIFHAVNGRLVIRVLPGAYSFLDGHAVVTEVLSVDLGGTYIFEITDSYGDGICCQSGQGFVFIYLGTIISQDQVILFERGDFQESRQQSFLASEAGLIVVTPFPSVSLYPSSAPTTSVAPSAPPSVSPAPSQSARPTIESVVVSVWILLDSFPTETSWAIVRASDGLVVFSVPPGTYTTEGTRVSETLNLEIGVEFIFMLEDTASDGICCDFGIGNAFVYLGSVPSNDRVLAFDDGQFGSGRNHTFIASALGIIDAGFPTMAPTSPTVPVTVYFTLDSKPEEFGWGLGILEESMPPVIVASFDFGTYTVPGESVTETVMLQQGVEYTVQLLDNGADGICCAFGNGSFGISLGTVPGEQILYFNDGAFGDVAQDLFVVPETASSNDTNIPSTTINATTAPSFAMADATSAPFPTNVTTSPTGTTNATDPPPVENTTSPSLAPSQAPVASEAPNQTSAPSAAPSSPQPTSAVGRLVVTISLTLFSSLILFGMLL